MSKVWIATLQLNGLGQNASYISVHASEEGATQKLMEWCEQLHISTTDYRRSRTEPVLNGLDKDPRVDTYIITQLPVDE